MDKLLDQVAKERATFNIEKAESTISSMTNESYRNPGSAVAGSIKSQRACATGANGSKTANGSMNKSVDNNSVGDCSEDQPKIPFAAVTTAPTASGDNFNATCNTDEGTSSDNNSLSSLSSDTRQHQQDHRDMEISYSVDTEEWGDSHEERSSGNKKRKAVMPVSVATNSTAKVSACKRHKSTSSHTDACGASVGKNAKHGPTRHTQNSIKTKEAKLEAKREYNRRNAARARLRNKDMVKDLQQKVRDLTRRTEDQQRMNEVLQAQVEVLASQNQNLGVQNFPVSAPPPASMQPALSAVTQDSGLLKFLSSLQTQLQRPQTNQDGISQISVNQNALSALQDQSHLFSPGDPKLEQNLQSNAIQLRPNAVSLQVQQSQTTPVPSASDLLSQLEGLLSNPLQTLGISPQAQMTCKTPNDETDYTRPIMTEERGLSTPANGRLPANAVTDVHAENTMFVASGNSNEAMAELLRALQDSQTQQTKPSYEDNQVPDRNQSHDPTREQQQQNQGVIDSTAAWSQVPPPTSHEPDDDYERVKSIFQTLSPQMIYTMLKDQRNK